VPKLLGHYGIHPRIRRKFDNLVVLEPRQLFDYAARWRLERDPDEVLHVRHQGVRLGADR
jgi:hypothetical protein